MAADVITVGSDGLALRYFLRDRARLHEQFVDEALSKLAGQFVGSVDDLRELSKLPEFEGCLPELAISKIRRALDAASRASHNVDNFATPPPGNEAKLAAQVIPATADEAVAVNVSHTVPKRIAAPPRPVATAPSAALMIHVDIEAVDTSSPQEGDRSLACHLLIMVSLMLVQAVCVALGVAMGLIDVDWGQVGFGTTVLVTVEITRRALAAWLRTWFMRSYVGLTPEQTTAIEGPRRNLPTEWLNDLLASPKTKRRIKICDVVFRKGGHVFTLTFMLFFTGIFGDHGAVVFSLSTGALILIVLQAAVIWYGPRDGGGIWRLYFLLFGASDRIRDGRFGMRNAIGGSVSMLWGVSFSYIITLLAIGDAASEEGEEGSVPGLFPLMTGLVLLPITYGDAMGEIIGTPFGGRWFWKFNVRGFGEINQKSIEGCIAVFFGSLIPCLIVVGTTAEAVTPATWALPFLLASLTTATETFSFRSTDNFVIPVCNAVFVVLWWHLTRVGGIMEDSS